MPRYAITEKAGPFVAAHRNTGVGTILHLSERQAEHELRLGTLAPLAEPHGSVAVQPWGDPPLVAPARSQTSSLPDGEQEADVPAQSRKQKRSAT